jgi:hypothetical protein
MVSALSRPTSQKTREVEHPSSHYQLSRTNGVIIATPEKVATRLKLLVQSQVSVASEMQ